jgi:predicted O-methyltransferase YrrM
MHLPWRDLSPGPGPAINTSITEREAAKLRAIAEVSVDVLEIGAAFGYSAIVMGLAGARVTSVDPHTAHSSFGQFWFNVGAYGLAEKVAPAVGYSEEMLPMLASQGARYDAVFIDGDHRAAGVEHDVTWALKLLRPGGALACHDYGEDCCCPDVRPTLDRLIGDPGELTDTLFVVNR